MPSAARLAQGALPKIHASKSNMIARMTVARAGAASSNTMAPTTARMASSDSIAEDRIAGHNRLPPSFCLGVRRKAA